MKQWITLFKKEQLEMLRNFKWVWLPLVFIILGMTDPLSSYYMPRIIDAVGGMPEGTVIEMPTPQAAEVLLATVSQLNLLGVLIIVLASMGVIAAERKSGLAAMVLVKPIPIINYVTAKWLNVSLIGCVSLFVGYITGWYYTSVLFGTVSFELFLQSYVIFAIWYTFVLTLTIFFSAIFKVAGVAGFITLTIVISLSILTNIMGDYMIWSPAQLGDSVASLIMVGQLGDGFWLSLSVTVLLVVAMLFGATKILENKELE
ncbi:ABC transporter permease [Anaerobacillus arseniciselenatis]|uniref:ABC transporter permease n=1 Tax=Anaerobacillus arseniciselenatis TaxID=85682 RepID=A0A1S2LSV1_9BACI|nr:ABC transporter permease subunit [Anaerobacillus arseniciselenatis]OIJ15213.1 ABC transporter permease [Anaerobacillus arseniciselenatis]